jgi:hypothetical protein
VKEIDQAAKEAATALQVIHSDISKSEYWMPHHSDAWVQYGF